MASKRMLAHLYARVAEVEMMRDAAPPEFVHLYDRTVARFKWLIMLAQAAASDREIEAAWGRPEEAGRE